MGERQVDDAEGPRITVSGRKKYCRSVAVIAAAAAGLVCRHKT